MAQDPGCQGAKQNFPSPPAWVLEPMLHAQPHGQSHPLHPSKAQAVPPHARLLIPLPQACRTTEFWLVGIHTVALSCHEMLVGAALSLHRDSVSTR